MTADPHAVINDMLPSLLLCINFYNLIYLNKQQKPCIPTLS